MNLESLIQKIPRMVGSKGRYSYNNPSHFVIFNCVILINNEQIHVCDMDFSLPVFSEIVEQSKVEPGKKIHFKYETGQISVEVKGGKITKNPDFTIKKDNLLVTSAKNTEIKELLKPSRDYILDSMQGVKALVIPQTFYKTLDFDEVFLKCEELEKISKMPNLQRPFLSFYWHKDDEVKFLKKYYSKLKRKYKDEYTIYKSLAWVTLDLPLTASHADLLPGFIYYRIKSES